jgi:DNA-binding transcriptional ArsR family regulator
MDGASKQPTEMGPLFRRARTDPLIARAVSHPRRMAVLAYLMHKQDEASDEAELAEWLTLSLPAVRYHLTVLRGADLIACVGTGATARYVAAAAVDA